MRTVAILMAVMLLVSCGANGAPTRPKEKETQTTTSKTGVSISGHARVGVSTRF